MKHAITCLLILLIRKCLFLHTCSSARQNIVLFNKNFNNADLSCECRASYFRAHHLDDHENGESRLRFVKKCDDGDTNYG